MDTLSGVSTDNNNNTVNPDECPFCHGIGFVHPLLNGQPDYSQIIPCKCVRTDIEKDKLAHLQKYSNLGSLIRVKFENIMPQGRCSDTLNQKRFERAYKAAVAYAQNPEGWFILEGPSGSGKTCLAAAIVNRRLERGSPAFFVVVPDLLDHLRATYSPSSDVTYDLLFEQIKNAPLLVLDDLGSQSSTSWAEEKLYQIINHRFNARLPMVVTTNIPVDELDERLRTRLTETELSHQYLLEDNAITTNTGYNILNQQLLQQMTLNNFDSDRLEIPPEQRLNLKRAYDLACNFARSPKGWLVFLGANGCGKTHLAAAIANYRRQKGEPVTFIFVPDFLDEIRAAFSSDNRSSYEELFNNVKKAPLLIMDDFGEESATSWAREKLYQIINYRYNDRLPTVVTTSMTLDNIDARISSRMADPRISTALAITAPDYRADHVEESSQEHYHGRRKKTAR